MAKEWNLPEPFTNVIREHHEEPAGEHQSLISVIRLTNIVTRNMGLSIRTNDQEGAISLPEPINLGLSEIQLSELEIHIEDGLEKADF